MRKEIELKTQLLITKIRFIHKKKIQRKTCKFKTLGVGHGKLDVLFKIQVSLNFRTRFITH